MTDQARLNAWWGDTIVRSLHSLGVEHVCISPGHRSAPLSLAFDRHQGVTIHTHMEERSGGFFGLGIAKATGRPVALVCTSGTAAVNFFPAVIEAFYSATPLVVLTADRPPELRKTGANQTIDQINLYGEQVRFFSDLPLPDDSLLGALQQVLVEAAQHAVGAPAGPVHLNIPFREPLTMPGELSGGGTEAPVPGKAARKELTAPEVAGLAAKVAAHPRGVLVVGPMTPKEGFPEALAALSDATGYPVLAESTSQVRYGLNASTLPVEHFDALLQNGGFTEIFQPEIVIRFGARPTSKALGQLLEADKPEQVIIDGEGLWPDGDRLGAEIVCMEPVAFCRTLAGRLPPQNPDTGWLELLRRWDMAAGRLLQNSLSPEQPFFEGHLAALCAELTPSDGILYVGNSMPVRQLERFGLATSRTGPLTVLSNRGASGIDGMTSSALGAAAGSGRPVCLYLGDMSFYHDLPGLAAATGGMRATLVVANNNGGNIFANLPVASLGETFERLFRMPHGLEFKGAAEMFGLEYHRVSSLAAAREAIGESMLAPGVQIIEAVLDPAEETQRWQQVQAALKNLQL